MPRVGLVCCVVPRRRRIEWEFNGFFAVPSNNEHRDSDDDETGISNDRSGDFTHVVKTYQAVSESRAMKSILVTNAGVSGVQHSSHERFHVA